jgi:hypothetical protein
MSMWGKRLVHFSRRPVEIWLRGGDLRLSDRERGGVLTSRLEAFAEAPRP